MTDTHTPSPKMTNGIDHKLDGIFSSDLKYLMVISYIVLGNNKVTNQFIEQSYKMPVHAWSALYAIVKFPGILAKEIVELFPRPQNTVSRAIALLEQRGLVRQEPSESDGRQKKLFATEEGDRLLSEIQSISLERQSELFSPLTHEEREVFFLLARKIAVGAGATRSAVLSESKA